VLWGGYVEEMPDGTKKTWRPGMAGVVRPDFVHRIDRLLARRSFSLWLRGPITHKINLVGPGWPQGMESDFAEP
jgi:hypothetical protein